MIEVTRIDGSTLFLGADLIESIRRTPDTVIHLLGGESLIVEEAPGLILHRIVTCRRLKRACGWGSGQRRDQTGPARGLMT